MAAGLIDFVPAFLFQLPDNVQTVHSRPSIHFTHYLHTSERPDSYCAQPPAGATAVAGRSVADHNPAALLAPGSGGGSSSRYHHLRSEQGPSDWFCLLGSSSIHSQTPCTMVLEAWCHRRWTVAAPPTVLRIRAQDVTTGNEDGIGTERSFCAVHNGNAVGALQAIEGVAFSALGIWLSGLNPSDKDATGTRTLGVRWTSTISVAINCRPSQLLW